MERISDWENLLLAWRNAARGKRGKAGVAAFEPDSKQELWEWKQRIVSRLAKLRLTIHEGAAQVAPVAAGIPWLGFVVYPTHRLLKGRKAVGATRQLGERFEEWRAGRITFAEFDASVQGWVNHVRYADTWGLQREVLGRMKW